MEETVSNAIEITQAEIADLDRSRGDIEVAFVDMNNNPISGSNVPTPKLGTGMTAKKWNAQTSTWDTVTSPETDKTWYNYENKQWANAWTEDGSMWVWIPRYSYKIAYKDTSGNIIGYSDSDGITDINGNIVTGTKKQGAVEVKGTVDGKTIERYVLHPAFQKFATDELTMTNGGWKEEIQGIWVAKFEASHADATGSSAGSSATVKIQPGVRSWRDDETINVFMTKCSEYNTAMQSHMMKNSEWGVCAYLATSKYGKNDKVTINSNTSNITGGGSGTEYMTNTNQSTTGNVYGIYDMSGGTNEYVVSYINNKENGLESLMNSINPHLKQVYSIGDNGYDSDGSNLNYRANKARYGDAIYETSMEWNSNSGSWYGEYSFFPTYIDNIFVRGGGYGNKLNAGVFYYNKGDIGSVGIRSFRPVLIIP